MQGSESLGTMLANAGANTLIGMGVVFAVLILISFIIYLFKFIHRAEEKMAGRKKENEEKTPGTVTETEKQEAPGSGAADSTELVAVIAAAIAAYEGKSADGIIVRSIRRIPEARVKR